MKRLKAYRVILLPVLAVALLAAVLALKQTFGRTGSVSADGTEFNYLPITMRRFGSPTVFGVEMEKINLGYRADLVQQAGVFWVRSNGLLWSDVQPTLNGGYQWGAVAALEEELFNAPQYGLNTVLVIRSTPAWAQLYPGMLCGPMKQTYFDEFGAFLAAAVERYSAPPYNVTHYEIWNEPDIEPGMVPTGSEFYGCWGDAANAYYGGGYYGDMLEVVYPMIKAANPDAQVLVGGLLLDCDPRDPPPGRTCKPSKFLEGILVSGAEDAFDGISFHAYDYYNPDLDTYGNTNWNSGKLEGEPNGVMQPVALVKADFLREVLADYGVTDKFLMNTELALLCGGPTDPPGGAGCEAEDTSPYELMKASFLAQAYAASIADGLSGSFWFAMRGWRNSGLLYIDYTPRPAYTALDFSQTRIGDARFTGQVSAGAGVRAYKYSLESGGSLWVAWSTDGAAHVVTLPAVPLAIWDPLGITVPVTGNSVTVTTQMLYIKMP